MNNEIVKDLSHIKRDAIINREAPETLINRVTVTCKKNFKINQFYDEMGLLSGRDAMGLLNNDILAAKRQHDLTDAEAFREQKRLINDPNASYIETIHGCHIAPTVRPVNHKDVINLITILINRLKRSKL